MQTKPNNQNKYFFAIRTPGHQLNTWSTKASPNPSGKHQNLLQCKPDRSGVKERERDKNVRILIPQCLYNFHKPTPLIVTQGAQVIAGSNPKVITPKSWRMFSPSGLL